MNTHTAHDFTIALPNLEDNCTPLIMKWVPSGKFVMGKQDAETGSEECRFEVEIQNGFWLSQYPVTVAQWRTIMHKTSPLANQENKNHPVTEISWYQAVDYCKRLDRLVRNKPQPEYVFTLPTEVQWEYSCQDQPAELTEIAWYSENSGGQLQDVGQKKPNDLGLYDMLGNVMQWCLDSPSDYPCTDDPITLNPNRVNWIGYGSGHIRSIRGASFRTPVAEIDRAARGWVSPNEHNSGFGFRVCFSQRHKIPLQVRAIQLFFSVLSRLYQN